MYQLIIKSNSEPDSETNTVIAQMLEDICSRDIDVGIYTELGYGFPIFSVQYDESELMELKESISALYDILLFPHDKYKSISSKDFTISVESVKIDPSHSYLYEKQNELNDARFETLALIANEQAIQNKKLEEKIDAVYAFLQSSGLLHYKQTFSYVTKKLEENKILNSDEITSKIFPNVH
jgi:hypothetical protein